jgi:hypothetical protein
VLIRGVSCLLVAAIALLAGAAAQAAPGDLDPSWDGDGKLDLKTTSTDAAREARYLTDSTNPRTSAAGSE